MADQKITELTELTVINDDDIHVVVDSSTNTTKKITNLNLVANVDSRTIAIAFFLGGY